MPTSSLNVVSDSGAALSAIYIDKNTNASATAASAASTAIEVVDCDNRANTTEDVYFKAYNNASPTIGTTAPDIVLRAKKGERILAAFGGGITLGTAATFIAAQEAATPNSGTNTNPSAAVITSVGAT